MFKQIVRNAMYLNNLNKYENNIIKIHIAASIKLICIFEIFSVQIYIYLYVLFLYYIYVDQL